MDTELPRRADACLRHAARLVDAADAALLLAHALDKPRAWLFAHGDALLAQDVAACFDALLRRRIAGEPIAHLIGRRGFWNLDLAVTRDVLIPRPETELLVELALARLPAGRALRVADLGTGSGAIALALAKERPLATVIATDASLDALAVARSNAQALQLENVEFRHGDWLEPVAGEEFALMASNPPYIESADPHLGEGDLRYEPAMALASGPDGLDAIRGIVRDGPAHLVRGGWLLLEHGWQQGAAVRALLAAAGLRDIATHRDLEDRERVTLGQL